MAAVLSVALAEDSELDSDPRVIPYNGVLEFNGTAYNGQADFRFSIVTEDGNDCTFIEEQGDVVVYSGRFGVNLGSSVGTGVDDCIFNSQEVYIAIEVRDSASDGEYTELSGRQRIRPVPFSYWSAEGSDFKVDGGMAVGGNLTVAGTVSNPSGDVVIANNGDTNNGSPLMYMAIGRADDDLW